MDPAIELDAQEARVLGVLIEKSLTTPDQYPLTLNAATSGSNQKSNRNPVLELSESEVHSTLSRLIIHHLVGAVHPSGSRVEKYRHNGEEVLRVETGQLAILAELLMRGPQSPGELRTRVNRMSKIDSLELLGRLLDPLMQRGLVQRLAPAPGSRSERYMQLLSPGLHPVDPTPAPSASPMSPPASAPAPASTPGLGERVEALEREVAALREQLADLARQLGEPI